jgi:two-component system KDP operon response regulator KdpE
MHVTLTTSTNHVEDNEPLRIGDLELDWREMTVRRNGEPVHLTPIEFRLLSVLVWRRGWVVPYEQILRDVWGPSYIGERANLKLYVWYLRRKLERDPSNPQLIQTRRGIGYIFAARSLAA